MVKPAPLVRLDRLGIMVPPALLDPMEPRVTPAPLGPPVPPVPPVLPVEAELWLS
jgi:hypothetical protein